MPDSHFDPITVTAVDREIASGSWRLKFEPAIEEAFERETGPERHRAMIVGGVLAVVLFDLFLVNDWFIMNDVFGALVVARLLVFTPLAIIGMALSYYSQNRVIRECTLTFLAILAISLPMWTMTFSDSPAKQSYQYGSLLVMMFMTVIQRMQFRYAIFGLTAIVAIQSFTTYVGDIFEPNTYNANVMFFVSAAILMLLATYTIERENRRSYLYALRGQLLFDQVEQIARVDALTGLLNRRSLTETAERIWTVAGGAPCVVSAILIDIDHFKAFNDSYGHLEGDTCLRRISKCIANVATAHDVLAFRYGGEEMLVLLRDREPSDARQIAIDIADAIRDAAIPHRMVGPQAIVSASMGVAGVMVPDSTIADLISAADVALYAAKRAGRNCIWPPVAARTDMLSRKAG